jgi:CelD/BcsL family acetyltransferase involved in cellulose biosynthesis
VITDALRKHFAEADVRCQADAGPTVLLDVPGSVEEYLKSLGKEKRRHVNRAQKELTKAHRTGFRLRQTHEEMAEVMERFFEAHEVFWRKRGLRGYFNEWPKAKEFHRRLVERLAPGGRAFMAELVADDAVVARTYGYRSGGIIHSMQTTREDGREWESMGVGHIIFLRMVEHAIAAGVKTVDRGGRPIAYKLEMGGRLAPMKLVTITRRGKGTAARLTLFRAAAWVLDKAYDGLWYRRIAPRIGMTGKPYWDVWVRSRIALPGGGEVREVKAE